MGDYTRGRELYESEIGKNIDSNCNGRSCPILEK